MPVFGVCMCVYAGVLVHAHMSVKARGQPQLSLLRGYSSFQDGISHCSGTCQIALTGLPVNPRILPVLSAAPSSVITRVHHTTLGFFYMGSGGRNSGPHTCKASSLSTELFPYVRFEH